MAQPNTNIEASTQTGTPTAQKIAFGVLMLGTLSLGASVVLGLVALPKRPRTPTPEPFRPTRVFTGMPDLPWEMTDATIYFSLNGNALAWYNLANREFTSNSDDPVNANSNSNVNGPLPIVNVNGSVPPNGPFAASFYSSPFFVWPSRSFTINTNLGWKTLCLPETTTSLGGNQVYYYDVNGTPYADALLRQPMLTSSCSQLLARGYRPNVVSDADLSRNIGGEQGSVTLTFWRKAILGTLNGQSNVFTQGAEVNSFGSDPLAIALTGETETGAPIAVESRTVTVSQIGGQPMVLCLPPLSVTSNGAPTIFFFDSNGTPYHDNLLRWPALPTSCATIMARSFMPVVVENATADQRIDESHGLQLYNRGALQGTIDGPTWVPAENQTIREAQFPLVLVLAGGTGGDVVQVPRLSVTVRYDGGQAKQLCFPAVQDAHVLPSTAFFYDASGAPYRDTLLQEPVPCTLGGTSRTVNEVTP